ncbi:MAG TPA: chemotaxis protein CheA [Vicinamibacteria bacterium]|nr:chemotaxis protein CheA [Vicinamibacteria bacterium]
MTEAEHQALMETFLAESEEGLLEMERALVGLEAHPDDDELLQAVFRTVHTLKGNAVNLGFPALAKLSHLLEDLLDRLREGERRLTSELASLLFQAVDALRELVPAAVAGHHQLSPRQVALKKRLARALREGAESDRPQAADVSVVSGGGLSGAPARGLRVSIEKLDRLLNLAGEIAVARGRLRAGVEALSGLDRESLLQALQDADRLHLELHELAMKVRMVPVGTVFLPHLRTVRDLALARGKRVRLEIEGAEAEVDTTLIENIRDPLAHMIRNAVDHGLEAPDERVARGKEPEGRLFLRARHQAGAILIEVEDDGRGLDQTALAERGRALGVVAEGQNPSPQEVARLIFEPGLSTAQRVTETSGRGVGMDVVRKNVEALRGSIGVESRQGEGTRFSIRLPLTVAIVDGFAVVVGGETYVIPLERVVECLELPPGCRAGAQGVLSLRGRPLPFLRLRDVFQGQGRRSSRESAVVVRYDGGHAGLAVDQLLGEVQTVIRPLGRLFRDLPGVAGGAVLGNGRVGLILDVPGLLRATLACGAMLVA